MEVYYETRVGSADPRDIKFSHADKEQTHNQEEGLRENLLQEYIPEDNLNGIREGLRLHNDLSIQFVMKLDQNTPFPFSYLSKSAGFLVMRSKKCVASFMKN